MENKETKIKLTGSEKTTYPSAYTGPLERDLTEALAFIKSEEFHRLASGISPRVEMTCLVHLDAVQEAISGYYSVRRPYQLARTAYDAHAEFAKDSRGLIDERHIPASVLDELSQASSADEAAEEHLNQTLGALVADHVKDALEMAGVTDAARVKRITATVIVGGPDLPGLANPAKTCSFCGGEKSPDAKHCSDCERIIG